MAVERDDYRNGMARLATAVNVITSDGPAGRGGFTASAVCSVTDDPATLLVCVNLASRQAEILRQNGVLCVNTLAAGQARIANLFASRDVAIDDRYAAASWTVLDTGAPALDGAVVSFDCRIVERLERSTHAVVLCEVQAVRVNPDAEALVYLDRSYRSAEQAVEA